MLWPDEQWLGWSLIAIGIAVFLLGLRFDDSGIHLWQWRDRDWWKGLGAVSIRDAGCISAGVSRSSFDESEKAQAFAAEFLSLVNGGYLPLHNEKKTATGILESIGSTVSEGLEYGPFGPKTETLDSMIAVSSIKDRH